MRKHHLQELADDAARLAGALLAEVRLCRELGRAGDTPTAVWVPAALAGPKARTHREALQQWLGELHSRDQREPPSAGTVRVTRITDRLPPELGDGDELFERPLFSAELSVRIDDEPAAAFFLVLGEEPHKTMLRSLRALGREATLLLSARRARSQAEAELKSARALAERAAQAASRLRRESDPERIPVAIGAELRQLQCHAALVLLDEEGQLRLAHLSFPAETLARGLKLLGLKDDAELRAMRNDPSRSPLLEELLAADQPLLDVRPGPLLRALFPRRSNPEVRQKLVKLFGLSGHLLLPLRGSGDLPLGFLLAIPLPGTSPDRSALVQVALQASWALEWARLREQLYRAAVYTEEEAAARTRDLRAENERLRAQDAAKDNFLANVSHELRSPLVTMLGYTDLLLGEKLGPISDRQRQCLQVARTSGKRLKQFIEELMDFSRFELTRSAVKREPFPLREVVTLAVAGMTPRLLERRIAVRQMVPHDLKVMADRERILQVLTNLLANAERHCRDGGRIEVRAGTPAAGFAPVAVQDNGSGIAPEHQARIFDRLYQVGDAKGTSRDGLGLGLNIVKSIVEAHGGTVTVRSEVGRGSTFTFTVPAA